MTMQSRYPNQLPRRRQQQQQQQQQQANSTASSSTTSNSSSNSSSENDTYDEEAEHIKFSTEQNATYLNSFPPQPETNFASSTYMTFVNPQRFASDALRNSTQYLTDKLRGVVWLDVNSDGIRGSSTNQTLNAMEYDVGVGGAKVELVNCDTDEILVANNINVSAMVQGITFPYEGGMAKRTDVPAAGIYEFPLVSENNGNDSDAFVVPPGRYYVMFTAPRDFRIIGNMLPLDRKKQQLGKPSDSASVMCNPFGGEGNAYRKKVEAIGDLDWEGHCGRSIGCFDVGKSFELKEKYPLLKVLNEGKNEIEDDDEVMDMEDYVGTLQNLVAIPARNTLNLGVSQDDWPLRTVQFAEVQLTLAFPSGTSDDDLTVAQNFAAENVTRAMQRSLSEYFHRKSPDDAERFDIMGVDLHGSRVIDMDAYNAIQEQEDQAKLWGTSSSSSSENNACTAHIHHKSQSPEEPPPRVVTYNFTIRGRYDPPPLVKLGPTALQSINEDPTNLFERLIEEMSYNDGGSVPTVFQEVEGAAACHMTLEKEPVVVDMEQCWSILPSMGDPLIECWSVLPVILLSTTIAILLTFLLIRRVRRVRLNALNDAMKSIRSYLHRRTGFLFR